MIRDFAQFLEQVENLHSDKLALSVWDGKEWHTLTYRELRRQSHETALLLQQAGIQKGDRVALLSPPSLAWVTHFFGILLNGAAVVPLDIKLTASEIQKLIGHSECKALVVDPGHLPAARNLRLSLDRPPKILVLDELQPLGWNEPMPLTCAQGNELAVICYTSGTLGAPKGVMVSTQNLLSNVESISTVTPDLKEDRMFSIVPMTHLYGLTVGLLYSLYEGMELVLAQSVEPEVIRFCLKEKHITHLMCVPLFLKMIRQGILQRVATEKSRFSQKVFHTLLFICRWLPLNPLKRRLFAPIHQALGGRLVRFLSGGAELNNSLYDFYKAVGIPVFNGYGLSETSPIVCSNVVGSERRGTVGRPLPGVEVQIDQPDAETHTGEIWVRGSLVFQGYFKDPELTRMVLTEDGWFKTGDIGYRDRGGYLHICGRSKALIVLASGKKVHPEEVEEIISQSPWVKACAVVGVRDSSQLGESVVAFVQPPDDRLKNFTLVELQRQIQSEVLRLTQDLAYFKRPQRVVVRTEPFVLTSTMKIKRDVLAKEVQG